MLTAPENGATASARASAAAVGTNSSIFQTAVPDTRAYTASAGTTKLSSTFFSPAFSKAMASLLASMAVIRP